MIYTNAKFENQEHRSVSVDVDGARISVPVDHENRHYQDLLDSGISIAPWQPPPPTLDDVRREAQKRMIKLVGARDPEHLALIISNGLRESARLLRKEVDGVALTTTETTRKQTLMQIDATIEAIRTASNTLEAMTPVPVNYRDDSWWP